MYLHSSSILAQYHLLRGNRVSYNPPSPGPDPGTGTGTGTGDDSDSRFMNANKEQLLPLADLLHFPWPFLLRSLRRFPRQPHVSPAKSKITAIRSDRLHESTEISL